MRSSFNQIANLWAALRLAAKHHESAESVNLTWTEYQGTSDQNLNNQSAEWIPAPDQVGGESFTGMVGEGCPDSCESRNPEQQSERQSITSLQYRARNRQNDFFTCLTRSQFFAGLIEGRCVSSDRQHYRSHWRSHWHHYFLTLF